MSRTVRASQGTWCTAFGAGPTAGLDQALAVISAFGYDGVELAGFAGHATIERLPDAARRRDLVARLDALGLEPLALAPAPDGGDALGEPWSLTDDARTRAAHRDWWSRCLDLAAELGVRAVRIDPGTAGPLPYGTDYARVWARVVEMFRWLADEGARIGCTMLWEMESSQPFNKPSEIVGLLEDVDHANCRLLYDTGHFHAAVVVGHNQVRPLELQEGGQVAMVRRLAGRIGHVHLCDTDGDIARNVFGRKLGIGKGVMDFGELLPVLAECYDGDWWGMDAIPLDGGGWDDAWSGLAFIRDVVARHVAEREAWAA
jgi:sugar phosphate isomerase/epimerase